MIQAHHPTEHLRKLRYVLGGFLLNWGESPGFRLHLAADALAIFLGVLFKVSKAEWLAISVVTAMKAEAELINTSVEMLVDERWPDEQNDQAKRIKDSAAAGVFASVLGSFAVWAVLFIPRILTKLRN